MSDGGSTSTQFQALNSIARDVNRRLGLSDDSTVGKSVAASASVSIGREEVKEQADTYLREHYRNADGEMTCQICKGPLPFKLGDGREYFEVVEFLPELRKRHPQNYLALCPNHSAMYRLVNDSKETIRESFESIESNELPIILAEKDITIYFSKTHIVDLKAVLEAEESLPPPPDQAVSIEGVLTQGLL